MAKRGGSKTCPYGTNVVGRVMGLEPMIFWATTRRVNPYTTPAMSGSLERARGYYHIGDG